MKKPTGVVEASDFGRKFGWFIEKDGVVVGDLDYLRWDSWAQFWHQYRVTWRKPEDAVSGPDAWKKSQLVLRNRRYTDVVVKSFMIGAEREEGVIGVRFAYVCAERINRDELA